MATNDQLTAFQAQLSQIAKQFGIQSPQYQQMLSVGNNIFGQQQMASIVPANAIKPAAATTPPFINALALNNPSASNLAFKATAPTAPSAKVTQFPSPLPVVSDIKPSAIANQSTLANGGSSVQGTPSGFDPSKPVSSTNYAAGWINTSKIGLPNWVWTPGGKNPPIKQSGISFSQVLEKDPSARLYTDPKTGVPSVFNSASPASDLAKAQDQLNAASGNGGLFGAIGNAIGASNLSNAGATLSNVMTGGMVNTQGTGALQTGGNTLGNVLTNPYLQAEIALATAGTASPLSMAGAAAVGGSIGGGQAIATNIGTNLQTGQGLLTGNWSNVPVGAAIGAAAGATLYYAGQGNVVDSNGTSIPVSSDAQGMLLDAQGNPVIGPNGIPASINAPPLNSTPTPEGLSAASGAAASGANSGAAPIVGGTAGGVANLPVPAVSPSGLISPGAGALLGAGIGAGGAIIGSQAQAQAMQNAAATSAQATQNALLSQQHQFDVTQQNLQPWLQAGTSALSKLGQVAGQNIPTYQLPGQPIPTLGGLPAVPTAPNLLGIQGPTVGATPTLNLPGQAIPTLDLTKAGTAPIAPDLGNIAVPTYTPVDRAAVMAQAAQDPATRYLMQQSQNAINASAAARGGLFTGQTGVALQENAQGLATQNYNNIYNQMAQQVQTTFGAQQQIYQDKVSQALSQYGAQSQQYQQAVQNLKDVYGADVQGYNQAVNNAVSKFQSQMAGQQQTFGQQQQVYQNQTAQQLAQYQTQLQEYGINLQNILTQYGAQSQEYQQALANANQLFNAGLLTQGTKVNQLNALAGLGQTATGQLASSGAANASAMSNLMVGQGQNAANLAIAGGQNTAQLWGNLGNALNTGISGYVAANAPPSALQQAQTNYLTAMTPKV